ncbi:MAG: rRNA maturation RNase YbeY [Clostridiales bacterium]|nr:rRNA maturation RNase YbeY [Clostridiales bacterium]
MTLQLELHTDPEPGLDFDALAREVAEKVLEMEECPYEAQVSLVITDNQEIHSVNREFRGIDAPTDVLSFPMIPFEEPAGYQVIGEEDACFDLDTGELLLGDIMISMEKVRAQAKEYGHSVKREYCFLVAHSMLHLLGYDHMTPEEAGVMEARQRQALEALGITR